MAASTKESVLTDVQIASLKIIRLIFHVINVDEPSDDKVVPLEEVVLDEDQKKFFLERIQSVSKGIQYNLIENNVNIKPACTTLLTNDTAFVQTSVELTKTFASHHRKHMSSGVFVTAIVQTLSPGRVIKLVFLAKFDHRNVYQILVKAKANGQGNEVVMQKIANNLVEDKSAIQKSALIDVGDNFDWDVLADERQLKPSGEITDYFKGFLGVTLKEVASVLTKRAVQSVGQWANSAGAELIPDDEERGNYRARAIAYMQTNDMFDSDGFIDAVIKDADNDRRDIAKAALKRVLEEKGIVNQVFPPKPNSLPKSAKKQIWVTNEGLVLEFAGQTTDFNLTTKPRADGQRGYIITIETSGYEQRK